MGTIETAAAAYVAARAKVLDIKRARLACKCELYEAQEYDWGDSRPTNCGILPCRMRNDGETCEPCVERERLSIELPKASAVARRRFITLAALVAADSHFNGDQP